MKQEIALCFLGEESSSPVVLLQDRQRYSLVSLAPFDRQNSCRKYIQAVFAGLQTKKKNNSGHDRLRKIFQIFGAPWEDTPSTINTLTSSSAPSAFQH